jgi:hypothetical protein
VEREPRLFQQNNGKRKLVCPSRIQLHLNQPVRHFSELAVLTWKPVLAVLHLPQCALKLNEQSN